jgi:hypothetical protein
VATAQERFGHFVYPEPNSGCFIWVGATDSGGRGAFSFAGKRVSAHRVAWLLAGRELPPSHMALRHKCDTPCCVNVDHLEVGTYLDNAGDMARRHRGRKGTLPYGVYRRGERYVARFYPLGNKGRYVRIGSFATIAEAAAAAEKAREARG